MHATHLTKKFNVLAVVYFTIIACGQIVLFPHSQPIFLFLVTMAMAVRLFTLRPQYKNLRFLVLSIISHHLVLPFFHSSNSISMPGIAGQVSLSIRWFMRLCSSGWDMCISTSGERVPNILPTSLVKRACMNCSTHKAIPLTFSCEVATGTGVPVKGSDCCTLPG